MDLHMLKFRSGVLAAVRDFFSSRGYLETDTPALAPALIPESCLEVFRTEYLPPDGGPPVPLFLLPSPELYLKKLLAAHRVPLFQISKCYRNCESRGQQHSPEFTMLEYYRTDADAADMLRETEELLLGLREKAVQQGFSPSAFPDGGKTVFRRMTVDEAFTAWAGCSLRGDGGEKDGEDFLRRLHARLAAAAERAGLGSRRRLEAEPLHSLYDILFIQCVEPELARGGPVFLTDYPAFIPCLAAENPPDGSSFYRTRARWELYAGGVELANCYTEERSPQAVRDFFDGESRRKAGARVPHPADGSFAGTCARLPPCSGVAMGADRLVMLLSGRKTIEGVLPFPPDIPGGF